MRDWAEVSPHFTKEEIFSPSTIDHIFLVDVPSLVKLNDFRKHLGRKLIVNFEGHHLRGVRSPAEQLDLYRAGITTAKNSMHVQGKAFDVTCPNMSPEELADAASDFGWVGIGIYRSANFVHIDNRCSDLLHTKIFWENV